MTAPATPPPERDQVRELVSETLRRLAAVGLVRRQLIAAEGPTALALRMRDDQEHRRLENAEHGLHSPRRSLVISAVDHGWCSGDLVRQLLAGVAYVSGLPFTGLHSLREVSRLSAGLTPGPLIADWDKDVAALAEGLATAAGVEVDALHNLHALAVTPRMAGGLVHDVVPAETRERTYVALLTELAELPARFVATEAALQVALSSAEDGRQARTEFLYGALIRARLSVGERARAVVVEDDPSVLELGRVLIALEPWRDLLTRSQTWAPGHTDPVRRAGFLTPLDATTLVRTCEQHLSAADSRVVEEVRDRVGVEVATARWLAGEARKRTGLQGAPARDRLLSHVATRAPLAGAALQ